MRFLDDEQRQQIGYTFLLNNLEVITAYGLKEKKNIRPYRGNERGLLIDELDKVEKLISLQERHNNLFNNIKCILMKVKDISTSIKRCESGEILDEIELFEIKTFTLLVDEYISEMQNVEINIEEFEMESLENILNLLDPEKRRLNTFYIYEEYSKTLKVIREKKREIEKKIYSEADIDKVQELKEERLNYVVKEEDESLKVRKKLSEFIKNDVEEIKVNMKKIGVIDLLRAKVDLALNYGGIRPDIVEREELHIVEGFNPEIVEILKGKNAIFTPVSIELKRGTTMITGANMGGKTITLKTIVLNIFLAQCGFFVYAKKARIPIFDFIYFISDDMQSISKGLSTFGAEIIKLREVVESAKRGKGFIALDEFARGTNPKEGKNLVKALAIYMKELSSMTLISTHYDGVFCKGMEHYQVIGLKRVDFKSLKRKIDLNKTSSISIIQKHMDYRLEKVYENNMVPKDALNISILLGLDDEIVNIIEGLYNEEGKNEE